MHFCLLDQVLESGEGRIVTLKTVSSAEEYLQDHFPRFPVLPGVFMLEAMVQAARELLRREAVAGNANPGAGSIPAPRMVLGEVKGVKYGSFVKPGDALRVEVTVDKRLGDCVSFKGIGTVVSAGGAASGVDGAPGTGDTAVAGRFTMRPLVQGGSPAQPKVATMAARDRSPQSAH